MTAKKSLSPEIIIKAITQSSKMEGLSFSRARKNKTVIKKLKTYGRAFSV